MYQIKRTQIIPSDLNTCWEFFMKPGCLEQITPANVRVKTISDVPERLFEGLIIEYRMQPLLRIPVRWVTEIKTVKYQSFFVDIQLRGPYRSWHHEHHFREVEGGVEMTDLVSYAMPFGFIGEIMHRLIVRNKLEAIFDHRRSSIERIFGKA
ncbi:MAG: hypothetical protein K0R65_652 [Crocinitomicaceae bacterium]|jgi:ligand-binding SRPBCC domain-containing protein|nr:hypothetical protein [Crocinitomicaceae bacterium]